MSRATSSFDPKRITKVTIFACNGSQFGDSEAPSGTASAELTPEDVSQTLAFGQFSRGPLLTNGGYLGVAETVDGQRLNLIVNYQGSFFCVLGDTREYFYLPDKARELLDQKLRFILVHSFAPQRPNSVGTASVKASAPK